MIKLRFALLCYINCVGSGLLGFRFGLGLGIGLMEWFVLLDNLKVG